MTSVPQSCTVLVVGGGPGGSYASAALAREGINVVLLEAEKFPRYHVGESMLPSMRHFLKFVDGYEKWDAHGFNVKKGGAFRLNWSRPETYTDFIAAGGLEATLGMWYAPEADDLLFKHAADCGVKTFDGTKVNSIEFASPDQGSEGDAQKFGRPVSATWSCKDGTSGTITLDYLIDASGRAGLISTKYLKNRSFNQGLKNIASWGYWKGGGVHGVGTHKEGAPYFEALKDASGWAWFIPLHNGTHSVGIVQNQDMATMKKKAMAEPSSQGFYKLSLELVPGIKELLASAELVSEIKSASDWSYSASKYAFPGVRIVGDAGSFIDPFFSSGVHLALSGGLSAAATIAAAIRGDCDEETAASWYDKKTAESYTRFLLVVSSALKQIRASDQPVLHDFNEESFERAFDLFRPVIQGQVDADTSGRLTQAEISKTLEFCSKAFIHVSFEEKEALINKLKKSGLDGDAYDENTRKALDEFEKKLTPEEQTILTTLKGRRMVRPEDSLNIDNFTLDSIDGLAPRLERGKLGLAPAKKAQVKFTTHDKLSYLNGEARAANKLENGHTGPQGNTTTNGTNGINGNNGNNGINGHNGHNGRNGNNGVTENASESTNHLADLLASGEQSGKTTLDELTRHRLMSSLHESAEELEAPYDTLARLVNAGRQVAMVKLAGDLGIFKSLVESKTPLSSSQLAKYSGKNAEPLLVARIVRYLVANRFVSEVDCDRYVARKSTHALADHQIEGALRFFHAVSNPSFQALPDYLRETGYQNQTAGSALKKGLNAEQGLFPWLKQHTDILGDFQNLMGMPRESNGWDVIPLDFSVTSKHQGPMLVDIGGGTGQQARLLVAQHPELAGRVIVQDREETIKSAPAAKGVQLMAHDFFETQPVNGAKYYYLRAILHNWEEHKAVQILANIVPAMSPDSLVLIDEVVISQKGAPRLARGVRSTDADPFWGSERTGPQWDTLLDRAGLKPVEVKKYAPIMESCVVFAARK